MGMPPPDSHPPDPLPDSFTPDPSKKSPINLKILIPAAVLGLGACVIVFVVGAALLAPRMIPALAGPDEPLEALKGSSGGLAASTATPAGTIPSATSPVEPSPLPTNTPFPTETPEPSLQPTDTPPPTSTPEPAAPTETEPPTGETGGYSSAFFEDDFSTMGKGWLEKSDDISEMGYHEGGTYALAVKEPNYYSWVHPPLDFPDDGAWKDIYVSFQARLFSVDGYFGIFCRYQDEDNTYEVAIRDGAYSIGKWVEGEYISLTSPEWVDTPYTGAEYTPGFPKFVVGCLGDTISLEINGYGVDPIVDSTFSQGDLAVFAVSGEILDPVEGFYTKLLLDTFTASIP